MSRWYMKRHSDGAKKGKTAFLYPNISAHWYRNLNLPNAMLKINSMDGLRGIAYAEMERMEDRQTLSAFS